MYAVSKEILPPSTVECTAVLYFTSLNYQSLVIAQGHLLTVYELLENTTANKTRLFAKLEMRLEGRVAGMCGIKHPVNGKTDLLLLSFADAKMSVLEYSTAEDSIKTVSMHYYEHEKYRLFHESYPQPSIIVDPANRCALLRFYKDQLAILPISSNQSPDAAPFEASFVINSTQIAQNIRNIVDIQFLHGYFEPTLAILYETNPTTTSRLSSRKDTINLAFVSISLAKRLYPVINTVSKLPYDLQRLVPLPKPVGGVLAAGVNEVMYFDQGTLGTGTSVNGYFGECSDFGLRSLSDLKLHLDQARFAVLSHDTLLISSSKGDIWRLKLRKDGRSVTRYDFEKVETDETTLAGDLVVIKPNFVFASGLNGDSLLYSYENAESAVIDRQDETRKKKPRLMSAINSEDADELDFFLDSAPVQKEDETQSGGAEDQFKMKLIDRLVSCGPIADFAMGDAAYSSEYYTNLPLSKRGAIELVTCSGLRQQSSFCTIQKTIKPYIRSTFDIPDETINMWTVKGSDGQHDKYLLLTKESKRIRRSNQYTIIYELGRELLQTSTTGFYTNGPTVFACSLLQNSHILQVYPKGMRLLDASDASKIVWEWRTDDKSVSIKNASSSQGFVCVHMSTALTLMFQVDWESKSLLPIMESNLNTKYAKINLFSDNTGLFSTTANNINPDLKHHQPQPQKKTKKRTVDELEDIYGSSSLNPDEEESPVNHRKFETTSLNQKQSTWFVGLTETGTSLEIRLLPSLNLVWRCQMFHSLPDHLFDDTQILINEEEGTLIEQGIIKDFALVPLGSKHLNRPSIIVLTKDGDLICYHSYFNQTSVNGRLCVSFRKATQCNYSLKDDSLNQPLDVPLVSDDLIIDRRFIFPFNQIKGLRSDLDDCDISGVFVAGCRPCFVFINDRNLLRLHPMTVDGGVLTFATFHNINCSLGFIYSPETSSRSLRVAQLDRRFDYHQHALINKVKINDKELMGDYYGDKGVDGVNQEMGEYVEEWNTPQMIEYHPQSRKYAIVSFRACSFSGITAVERDLKDQQQLEMTPEEQEQAKIDRQKEDDDLKECTKTKYYPEQRVYSIDLYSPKTWQLIDRQTYNIYENVVCISTILLTVKSSGMQKLLPFLVVGTATVRGEDTQSRGKIYIYEVIDVVPRPGQPETNHRLKLVKSEDMRGIVASVCSLNGYLCVAIGSKIMMYSFEDGETLEGVAFLDSNLYVTSMVSVRSLLVFGDVRKSIWFAGYQEEPISRLSVISKDFGLCTVVDLNLLVDELQLFFCVADDEGNLILFSFQPSNMHSFNGQKLIRSGDYFTGSPVSKLLRVAANGSIQEVQSNNNSNNNNVDEDETNLVNKNNDLVSRRQGCIYTCVDGTIGIIMPVAEKTFKRLNDIGAELTSKLEHAANLNPRAFRTLYQRIEKFGAIHPMRNVLDVDFLNKFCQQDLNERVKWARQRGTSSENVVNDLLDVEKMLNVL